MYTNKLKKDITKHLLRPNKSTNRLSTNPKVFVGDYIETHNIQPIIDEVFERTSFVTYDATVSERIYLIMNDLDHVPTCKCCETPTKFKRYLLGYGTYCSVKCRANDKDWQKDVADTNQERYGVTHIARLPEERKKRSDALSQHRKIFDFSSASSNRKETIKRLYGEHTNTGWMNSSIETRIRNGHMVPPEVRDEYLEYRREVELETSKQPIDSLPNCEFRGILGKDTNAHHLDHIYSIYEGFLEGIDPIVIGNICNLQFIPGRENISKGNKSSISKQTLLERYHERIRPFSTDPRT